MGYYPPRPPMGAPTATTLISLAEGRLDASRNPPPFGTTLASSRSWGFLSRLALPNPLEGHGLFQPLLRGGDLNLVPAESPAKVKYHRRNLGKRHKTHPF